MSSGASDSQDEGFRPSDLWHKKTWHSGTWLGPVRLTCKELRNKVDLMVTKLSVELADIPLVDLDKQLQVLPALCPAEPSPSFLNVLGGTASSSPTFPASNASLLQTLATSVIAW